MKKLVQSFFLLLFVSIGAFAQEQVTIQEVSGTITAKENGMPLYGVRVGVSGTGLSTETGFDGKFSIYMASQGTKQLELTFPGYARQVVVIDNNNPVNIALSRNGGQVFTQQSRTVTGIVTSKEKGSTLYGVSVIASGGEVGVQTGVDGRFSITVPQNTSQLEFVYNGYSKQVVAISDNNLNVALSSADEKVIAAQQAALGGMVKGVITDSKDGLSLPGVSVRVKGTTVGTTTNVNGNYSITIPKGATTLVFSYIGYADREVAINNQTQIDIALGAGDKQLDEVVITGFGLKQAKKDVSGAVVSISGKEIQNLPVQSFDKAMQGRLAGVQVTSSSGIPGAALNVRIRGVGSITAGNDPLYVIDGVQVSSGDNTSNATSSNALSSLNPDNIESIDVLKDAASAAVYGAAGANGVVVITTKRGKSGKTEFNFNSYFGYTEVIRKPELLTGPEWLTLSLEAYANRYGKTATQYTTFYNTYVAPFGSVDKAPTYNWYDEVIRKGGTRNYELSARGGDEKTRFYLSGGYNSQEGQVTGTDFNRGSIKLNFDHKSTNNLSFETGINASTITQHTTAGGGGFANVSRIAQLQSPINPIYKPDGTYNTVLPGAYDGYNPVQIAYNNTKSAKDKNSHIREGIINSLTGNGAAKYTFAKYFNFRSNFGLDYLEIAENYYFDPRYGDGLSSSGEAGAFNTRVLNWQTDQTLNFNKTFNTVHKV
ncbi:MAG: SusC/RagA family TonB-linked outer membrane protein, partial [Daejeonella sp.]